MRWEMPEPSKAEVVKVLAEAARYLQPDVLKRETCPTSEDYGFIREKLKFKEIKASPQSGLWGFSYS